LVKIKSKNYSANLKRISAAAKGVVLSASIKRIGVEIHFLYLCD
tara:strand:- start:853 stop:984 length:132 start_codon:yes stop_codon:yes gene_type:complete